MSGSMDALTTMATQAGAPPDTTAIMAGIAAEARPAAAVLRLAPADQRSRAIAAAADEIRARATDILQANAEDMAAAQAANAAPATLDRLQLDHAALDRLAAATAAIAAQPDPLGEEVERWTRPNGLDIAQVRVPIGVLAVIYESRPNVTADAAALSIRSGNAAILRCGSESLRTSIAIHAGFEAALEREGLPAACVQLAATTDRAAVGLILGGLGGVVDLIIPRGGRSLVERVQSEARAPVLAHLEGLNHTYLHAAADPETARRVVLNAKMRRVSICGATETLLVDADAAPTLLPGVAGDLLAAGCELRGDERARAIVPEMLAATEEDWRTEYLAPILAVRVVDGLDGAAAHIARYGSGHTEAIVTEDEAAAEAFVARVDSAIVLINASTQFADGGEFGFGAEIGISTARLHARGPVGARQLTTTKYVVRGQGQIRP